MKTVYLSWPDIRQSNPNLKYMKLYMAARRGHIKTSRNGKRAGKCRVMFLASDLARWLADEQAHRAGPKPGRVNGKSLRSG